MHSFQNSTRPATRWSYSTYLGGPSFDWATGIAIDHSGIAYVAGYTSSSEFPQVSAVQPAFNGLYDAFVSELNAAGNAVVFSTFYGGSGADVANAIALDQNANIFTGGETSSMDLPLQAPIYSANLGGSTGWLLRLGVTAPPPQTPAAISVTPSSGSGSTVTFTAQYSDTGGSRGPDRRGAADEHFRLDELCLLCELHPRFKPVRLGERRSLIWFHHSDSGGRQRAEQPVYPQRGRQLRQLVGE